MNLYIYDYYVYSRIIPLSLNVIVTQANMHIPIPLQFTHLSWHNWPIVMTISFIFPLQYTRICTLIIVLEEDIMSQHALSYRHLALANIKLPQQQYTSTFRLTSLDTSYEIDLNPNDLIYQSYLTIV